MDEIKRVLKEYIKDILSNGKRIEIIEHDKIGNEIILRAGNTYSKYNIIIVQGSRIIDDLNIDDVVEEFFNLKDK